MPRVRVNGIHLYYEETGQGDAARLRARVCGGGARAGTSRCGSSPGATGRSLSTPAATRPLTFPPSRPPTPRTRRPRTSAGSSTRSGSRRPMSAGCPWAATRRSTSASAIRTEPCRCVVAGCGYGSVAADRARFHRDVAATAERFLTEPMARMADVYCQGPTRVQFRDKDPRGWQEFYDMFAAQSAIGHGLTMRGVQLTRPSVYELEAALERLTVPTLIVTGDEDEPCLEPGIFLKRKIRTSGLVVIPKAGHTINLEEPDAFNRAVLDFLTAVEAGRWGPRNPASQTGLGHPPVNSGRIGAPDGPGLLGSADPRWTRRASGSRLRPQPSASGHERIVADREPQPEVTGPGDSRPACSSGHRRRDDLGASWMRSGQRRRSWPLLPERDAERLGEPSRPAGQRGQRRAPTRRPGRAASGGGPWTRFRSGARARGSARSPGCPSAPRSRSGNR